MVDGCSRLQAFFRIVLPLSGPGIAAVAIFSTLFSYNEFFIASVFLRSETPMPIPVGVQMFMQQYCDRLGEPDGRRDAHDDSDLPLLHVRPEVHGLTAASRAA